MSWKIQSSTEIHLLKNRNRSKNFTSPNKYQQRRTPQRWWSPYQLFTIQTDLSIKKDRFFPAKIVPLKLDPENTWIFFTKSKSKAPIFGDLLRFLYVFVRSENLKPCIQAFFSFQKKSGSFEGQTETCPEM